MMLTSPPIRHTPRPCLLSVLQPLAPSRWIKEGVYRHRRHPVGLLDNHHTRIHFRQEGANVDRTQKNDGEVLDFNIGWAGICRLGGSAHCRILSRDEIKIALLSSWEELSHII